MELDNAIAIIKEVGADFKGTLIQHQNIQNAIKTIEEALTPPEPTKEDGKK